MIDWLDQFETDLVAIVAKIAPWAAPIPTFYLVWEKTVLNIGWPWWVGLLAALPIEALGLVTAKLALDLYGYNRTKLKSEPPAPLWLASLLVATYFIVAELLTLGLHIAPLLQSSKRTSLADWSLALFPLLTLAAVTAIAVRIDHRQRLFENEAAAAERKTQRKQRKQERRPAAESGEPGNIFRCEHPGCERTFASQNALNAHARAHNNGREHKAVSHYESAT